MTRIGQKTGTLKRLKNVQNIPITIALDVLYLKPNQKAKIQQFLSPTRVTRRHMRVHCIMITSVTSI